MRHSRKRGKHTTTKINPKEFQTPNEEKKSPMISTSKRTKGGETLKNAHGTVKEN